MPTATSDYRPPSVAAMRRSQNEPDALRLLIAQRRLYRRAKRWLGLRWLGMGLLALAAPVVAMVCPSLAVVAGGVAGAWLFLGRTALFAAQGSATRRAAAVQEQFDFHVFGMPDLAERSSLPTIEEIAAIAGPDSELEAVAKKEELLGWYPFDEDTSGTVAVAIAQRANVAYANSLLRTTAIVWGALITVWLVALVAMSAASDLEPSDFLLGVIFPLLPAGLDVWHYVRRVWRSASERADLARVIEVHLTGRGEAVTPDDLLVWQERLFSLRTSAPDVPDLLYKLKRDTNERAMHSAASQLSKSARNRRS